jgi:hypothetical protein
VRIDTAELERRMRPGAWSEDGFLGQTESLSDVFARDVATLSELGVGFDELADCLSLLIEAPKAGLPPLASEHPAYWQERFPTWEEDARAIRAKVVRRFGSLDHADLFSARVGGRFEIDLTVYLGSQWCPWSESDPCSEPDDAESSICDAGSNDWRIRNTERGIELSGPTLISHLIREHHFFEGFESPYRVDPRALAELLELGPFSN